jgi:hypothetical protein
MVLATAACRRCSRCRALNSARWKQLRSYSSLMRTARPAFGSACDRVGMDCDGAADVEDRSSEGCSGVARLATFVCVPSSLVAEISPPSKRDMPVVQPGSGWGLSNDRSGSGIADLATCMLPSSRPCWVAQPVSRQALNPATETIDSRRAPLRNPVACNIPALVHAIGTAPPPQAVNLRAVHCREYSLEESKADGLGSRISAPGPHFVRRQIS